MRCAAASTTIVMFAAASNDLVGTVTRRASCVSWNSANSNTVNAAICTGTMLLRRPDREQLRGLSPLLVETNDGLVSWLDDLDGYPSKTTADRYRKSNDPLNDMTAVERCADARWRIDSYRAQLIDDHTAVGQLIGSYLHTITQARSVLADAARLLAAEQGQPLCDGRHLEGADTSWTEWSRNPNNGWRREFCERIAVAHGLCDTCLLRHQRWRRRHGLPPLTAPDPKDTQP